MLKKSLTIQTNPMANKENIVLWKDYRVTILQDRLFRLEKSQIQKFRDDATQSVLFRNVEKQAFTTQISDNKAIIDTGKVKLILKPNREDCKIEIDGVIKDINNNGNLLGTARTLDICDGDTFYPKLYEGHPENVEKLHLGTGVCSKTGIAVFNDENSLTLLSNGEISSKKGNGSDEYVFAFGDNYREAIQALYLITGKTPKIPRFALGNWWSRYHDYSDKEYLTLLNRFEENNVPLTVATIDMDWHYSGDLNQEFKIEEQGRNTDYYGGAWGWTGYSWNKKLFPDYKKFLKEIEKKNLKITLNLHPADGVRWFEDQYNDMAKAMDVDPATCKKIPFNIADTNFLNAYFDILHKPYEKDGVRFWWIDWQQGADSQMEGLDPLWALNHYHYLDNLENHSSSLILSRYAGIGSHRYPLGFSGDTFVTWKTLEYLPYFTATASNVGYTWWSHDIGGHQRGEQVNEMYVRHIQYGVFSPINRLHCSDLPTMTKEPWAYENGTGKIVEDFLRFRHSLIPFLYTMSYQTNTIGKALVEPLYYEYKTKQAYKYKNEYLFGNLLVAPITSHAQKDGYAKVKMWIPKGKWTDIFTGDIYDFEEDKEITLLRHLESIPVLAKAGTILPLSLDKGNCCKNPKDIQVNVYNGNGEFTLYEDGGEDEKLGEYFTRFVATNENNKQILTISTCGDSSVIPSNRTLKIVFKNLQSGNVAVYKNGVEQEIEEQLVDNVTTIIQLQDKVEYKIVVQYKEKTKLEEQQERIEKILVKVEDVHLEKFETYKKLIASKSIEEFKQAIQESKLKKANKQRLLETL